MILTFSFMNQKFKCPKMIPKALQLYLISGGLFTLT